MGQDLHMTNLRPLRSAAGIAIALAAALAVPATTAVAAPPGQLSGLLARSWQIILETPVSEGPWTGGNPCLALGEDVHGRPIISPSAPLATAGTVECDVPVGTAIFVTAFSSECSTLESEAYDYGRNQGSGMKCARDVDRGIELVSVRVDDVPVPLSEVTTRTIEFSNPPFGLLGDAPVETVLSAAHGWVTLLEPLPVGDHTIEIAAEGTYLGVHQTFSNTTTIHVG
jgi:hypothetical protein